MAVTVIERVTMKELLFLKAACEVLDHPEARSLLEKVENAIRVLEDFERHS